MTFWYTICLYRKFQFICSKKVTDPGTLSPTGTDSSTGTSTSSTAKISDILNIMIFPADNSWNQDISTLAVDPNSIQILSAYSASGLKSDFVSGLWDNTPIGIPFVVVCGSQQKLLIVFRANSYDGDYGDKSDPGPYPIPLNAPNEHWNNDELQQLGNVKASDFEVVKLN